MNSEALELFDLSGQVAFVTGATGGIGTGITRTLAKFGAGVVLADLPGSSVEGLIKEVQALGARALFLPLDVADSRQVAAAIENAIQEMGKIDILVNNAGIVQRVDRVTNTVTGITEENWDKVIAVNLKGPFLCSRAVLPHMIERRRGSIINLSSIIIKWGSRSMGAAYGASKAGVANLTKALATEGAPHGIRVNALAPHAIDAGLTHQQTPAARAQIAATVPLGRLGKAEEVGQAVVFLASPMSSFITGQVIHINGGVEMVD